MVAKKELDKMIENPKAEIRKRIRAALQGEFKLFDCIVSGIVFDDFHGISGKINNKGKYILKFNISKKV